MGIVWVMNHKDIVAGPHSVQTIEYNSDAQEALDDAFAGEEPVSEIVIKTGRTRAERARRARIAAAEAAAEAEAEARARAEAEFLALTAAPSTYRVWFESERGIGVCKITYEGGTKTANLHVVAHVPEGELSFSYQCGDHRGQGSIDVESKRVNGVLFCEKAEGVAVKTVRRKDARCANR
jgi:hypothetical protein